MARQCHSPAEPGAVARARRTALYEAIRAEELAKLGGPDTGRLREAAEILDVLVGAEEFVEFLTLPAYGYLE